jgi:hypothetical protein
MRSRLPLLAIALLWLPCALGRAATPALTWEAPASCPDAQAVRDMLQRVVDPAQAASIRAVRAKIVQNGIEYELDLELQTLHGSQRSRLSAEQCRTFVELLALELSLSAAPGEALAVPAEAPRATLGWGARASATLATGPTPAPAPGVALALALSRRRMRLELAASYAFRREIYYAEPPAVGVWLDMFGGEARGCYGLALRRIELPLCAGAELGALGGSALGVEQRTTGRQLWAALFAAPALRVGLAGPLSLWLELGVWIGLRRPSFGVQNLPVLYTPELFGVRGAAGLALHFD